MATDLGSVVAVSLVCEEDKWLIPQYLAETERLGVRFVMHFDRCSAATKDLVIRHKMYLGHTEQDNPKIDHHDYDRMYPYYTHLANPRRQHPFKLFLLWDIDETWERNAAEKMAEMVRRPNTDEFKVTWINVWGDKQHIRVDNPSNPYRIKAHRMDTGVTWTWRGPLSMNPYAATESGRHIFTGGSDLVCLNHGLMTRELRLLHKKRWDRVYGVCTPDGSNPYTYWNYLLDEENHPPVIAENIYL